MKDWINDVNGIQYGYDAANRLTTVTDYDGVEKITYGYDDAGRVTSKSDTHGDVTAATSYGYDVRGLMDSLTGPGGKNWAVAYNVLGQPTSVTEPNGMVTDYSYDARDRLDTITHKTAAAGSKVEEYEYTLDDAGLIDRIDHLDDCNAVKSSTRSDCSVTQSPRDHGSYWDYTYDTRYRLVERYYAGIKQDDEDI